MSNTRKDTIETRVVAVLVADGVDDDSLMKMKNALEKAGAMVKVVAPHLGMVKTAGGQEVMAEKSFLTAASVLFDAVYVPSGIDSVMKLKDIPKVIHFINEAYTHCKAIAANGDGIDLLKETAAGQKETEGEKKHEDALTQGVILDQEPEAFINAIAQHRFWNREMKGKVPA
jgi:catalase